MVQIIIFKAEIMKKQKYETEYHLKWENMVSSLNLLGGLLWYWPNKWEDYVNNFITNWEDFYGIAKEYMPSGRVLFQAWIYWEAFYGFNLAGGRITLTFQSFFTNLEGFCCIEIKSRFLNVKPDILQSGRMLKDRITRASINKTLELYQTVLKWVWS